jgi:hypothetical protein
VVNHVRDALTTVTEAIEARETQIAAGLRAQWRRMVDQRHIYCPPAPGITGAAGVDITGPDFFGAAL